MVKRMTIVADKPTISVPKHRAPDAAPHLDRTYTANELLRFPSRWHYELIEGYLRALIPTGNEHGACTGIFTVLVGAHILANDLGNVYAAETGFLLAQNPDTVKAPDFAFVARHRAPPMTEKFAAVVPDLVLETRSPGDRKAGVEEKIAEWLSFGTKYVLDLNPAKETLTIYRPGEAPLTLTKEDTFAAEDILPGLVLPLRKVFVTR